MNIINNIFSKKNILILLSILSVYLITALIWDVNRNHFSVIFKYFIYPLEFIGNAGVFMPFILLPFSISMNYLSYRVFKVWRFWTGLWFIIYLWIIFDAIKNPYHGSLGVYSSVDPYGYIPVFGLYILVSTIVILVTYLKEKKDIKLFTNKK